jgi:hypothetical protein
VRCNYSVDVPSWGPAIDGAAHEEYRPEVLCLCSPTQVEAPFRESRLRLAGLTVREALYDSARRTCGLRRSSIVRDFAVSPQFQRLIRYAAVEASKLRFRLRTNYPQLTAAASNHRRPLGVRPPELLALSSDGWPRTRFR